MTRCGLVRRLFSLTLVNIYLVVTLASCGIPMPSSNPIGALSDVGQSVPSLSDPEIIAALRMGIGGTNNDVPDPGSPDAPEVVDITKNPDGSTTISWGVEGDGADDGTPNGNGSTSRPGHPDSSTGSDGDDSIVTDVPGLGDDPSGTDPNGDNSGTPGEGRPGPGGSSGSSGNCDSECSELRQQIRDINNNLKDLGTRFERAAGEAETSCQEREQEEQRKADREQKATEAKERFEQEFGRGASPGAKVGQVTVTLAKAPPPFNPPGGSNSQPQPQPQPEPPFDASPEASPAAKVIENTPPPQEKPEETRNRDNRELGPQNESATQTKEGVFVAGAREAQKAATEIEKLGPGYDKFAKELEKHGDALLNAGLGLLRFSSIVDVPASVLEVFTGKTAEVENGEIVVRDASAWEQGAAVAGLVVTAAVFVSGGALAAGAVAAGMVVAKKMAPVLKKAITSRIARKVVGHVDDCFAAAPLTKRGRWGSPIMHAGMATFALGMLGLVEGLVVEKAYAADCGSVAGDVAEAALEKGDDILDSAGNLAKDFGGNVPWAGVKKAPLGEINATKHWTKHGAEFPEIKSLRDYVAKASEFVKAPPTGTLSKTARNGKDTVLYHPETNTLVLHTAEKLPTTMYRPSPTTHGYSNNIEFFQNHPF